MTCAPIWSTSCKMTECKRSRIDLTNAHDARAGPNRLRGVGTQRADINLRFMFVSLLKKFWTTYRDRISRKHLVQTRCSDVHEIWSLDGSCSPLTGRWKIYTVGGKYGAGLREGMRGILSRSNCQFFSIGTSELVAKSLSVPPRLDQDLNWFNDLYPNAILFFILHMKVSQTERKSRPKNSLPNTKAKNKDTRFDLLNSRRV